MDPRTLTQLIMASRLISEQDLIIFYQSQHKEATEKEAATQLEQMIGEINMKLLPLNYEIRRHKDKSVLESEGIYYSFVNLQEDESLKLQTGLSAEEVKVMVKLIAKCTEDGLISSLEALTVYKEETSRPMASGQRMFQRMIRGGWLVSVDGQYSMGPRLIAEVL